MARLTVTKPNRAWGTTADRIASARLAHAAYWRASSEGRGSDFEGIVTGNYLRNDKDFPKSVLNTTSYNKTFIAEILAQKGHSASANFVPSRGAGGRRMAS